MLDHARPTRCSTTCTSTGCRAGRIYTARDMFADEHFAAREAIVRLPHPEFGEFPMQNVFPRLSATPGGIRSLGPRNGRAQ
ncbi:CoA transferase [Nonomuraea ferruginea]